MTAEQPETPKPRWFRLTPGRFLVALLAVEALLWLSEHFRWLPWHKGYAALTAVAVVGGAVVLMLVWYVASLVFRWRFQFTIRSLLVLVVVVAILCGWLKTSVRSANEQGDAVRVIREGRGNAYYDFEVDAKFLPMPGLAPGEPAWLRILLGDDFFHDVVSAEVNGQDHTEGTCLAKLRHLRHLYTGYLTDEEIQQIGTLAELESLDLGQHHTDEGLRCLSGLTRLRDLDLYGVPITDAGLEHIGGLTQLETLRLTETKIGDAGLQHLKGLTKLKHLEAYCGAITDAGLEHIGELKSLESLFVGPGISDAGLQHLRRLTELKSLSVGDASVTPEGVRDCKRRYRSVTSRIIDATTTLGHSHWPLPELVAQLSPARPSKVAISQPG